MGLQTGDLRDTVISRVSIDEFEPKTGEVAQVVVVGFNVIEEAVGRDLYRFINTGSTPVLDVEVSPNPNPQDYFMVFVELDREKDLLKKIRKMVSDIENLTGKLTWTATTHLTDEYFPLDSQELETYVITDPKNYQTREEFEASQQQEDSMMDVAQESQKKQIRDQDILEFLKLSDLQHAEISESMLKISGGPDSASLEIMGFGDADEVMHDLEISESAIEPLNNHYRRFNAILGEMQAVPIDNYVVIYHPAHKNVIVGKPC